MASLTVGGPEGDKRRLCEWLAAVFQSASDAQRVNPAADLRRPKNDHTNGRWLNRDRALILRTVVYSFLVSEGRFPSNEVLARPWKKKALPRLSHSGVSGTLRRVSRTRAPRLGRLAFTQS